MRLMRYLRRAIDAEFLKKEKFQMSARAFRFTLQNESGHSLTKSFDHLCGGDWTPSLRPPDSIATDRQAAWRSESAGVATGTEAYVKYIIDGAGDTVYIYWDNPFAFGVTHAKGQVSTQDVEPDCDFQGPSGSTFPPPPSKFELFQSFASGGPGGPSGIGLIAELPFAPILVFGTAGIQEDAFMSLTLSRKSNSLRTFALRRGVDASKGIRTAVLGTGKNSLRSIMGL
jgi:hypothetical protein